MAGVADSSRQESASAARSCRGCQHHRVILASREISDPPTRLFSKALHRAWVFGTQSSADLHLDRARADSFGAAARVCDARRPRYPARLSEDLLMQGARTVLDVGAGTGIASEQFREGSGCACGRARSANGRTRKRQGSPLRDRHVREPGPRTAPRIPSCALSRTSSDVGGGRRCQCSGRQRVAPKRRLTASSSGRGQGQSRGTLLRPPRRAGCGSCSHHRSR
jgi:hypothetical protein